MIPASSKESGAESDTGGDCGGVGGGGEEGALLGAPVDSLVAGGEEVRILLGGGRHPSSTSGTRGKRGSGSSGTTSPRSSVDIVPTSSQRPDSCPNALCLTVSCERRVQHLICISVTWSTSAHRQRKVPDELISICVGDGRSRISAGDTMWIVDKRAGLSILGSRHTENSLRNDSPHIHIFVNKFQAQA